MSYKDDKELRKLIDSHEDYKKIENGFEVKKARSFRNKLRKWAKESESEKPKKQSNKPLTVLLLLLWVILLFGIAYLLYIVFKPTYL